MPNVTSEQEKYAKLKEVMEKHKGEKGNLMPVMQEAQDIFGFLSEDVQKAIADGLGVPFTKIYGVATFYTQFTLLPKGKNQIGVCLGTACYVRGSQKVLDEIKKELKVDVAKTTKDGEFSLDATRCLGCCGLAPVMMINEEVYGRLTPAMVPDILKKYTNGAGK
ncbi:MAG: NADH-quinone oxidoreductase subunit NuoE [Christensenellales bacterium]